MYLILLIIEIAVVSLGLAVHSYLAKHHARNRENVPDSQRLTFWTTTATLSIVFIIVMTELFNFSYTQGLIHMFSSSNTIRMLLNAVVIGVALVAFVVVFDLISPNNGFRKWLRQLGEKSRAKNSLDPLPPAVENSSNNDDREKDFELFVRTICYILFLLIMLFTGAAAIIYSSDAGKEMFSNSEVIMSMLAACTFALIPISIRQVIYYLRNMKRISKLDDDEETRRLYVKNFINKENTKL